MLKILLSLSTLFFSIITFASVQLPDSTGNVIFIHPDGTSLASWNALRILTKGPDGEINWDKLKHFGLYQGHTKNSISTSSNAGATMHAYGVKVVYDSYGMDGTKEITSLSGKRMSIMQEAMSQGINVGVINSGNVVEPGTGVFLASSESRANNEEISRKIIQSGASLIFAGGEEWLLPFGIQGRHSSGKRTDKLNLIDYALENGYTVVYTSEELKRTSPYVEKILGVFAANHTFNDRPEEDLLKTSTSTYSPTAPTLAEMTDFALRFFSVKNKQFFLVIEEEGTDNFGNKNNAIGLFDAIKRADDAIGIAYEFVLKNPGTLLLTAADSEAGGMEIYSFEEEVMNTDLPLPEKDSNGAPIDGIYGTSSPPFLSAPDQFGNRHPFAVLWSTKMDVFGSVVSKADGFNSHFMNGKIDNTDIYRIIYLTLFGKWLK
jgi:alkaline phosphatase